MFFELIWLMAVLFWSEKINIPLQKLLKALEMLMAAYRALNANSPLTPDLCLADNFIINYFQHSNMH